MSIEYNEVPAELPDRADQSKGKKIAMLLSPLLFLQLPPSLSFWVEKLPQAVSRENIQFRVMTKIIQNKYIVRNCHLKNGWGTGTDQGDITLSCYSPSFSFNQDHLSVFAIGIPTKKIQGKY